MYAVNDFQSYKHTRFLKINKEMINKEAIVVEYMSRLKKKEDSENDAAYLWNGKLVVQQVDWYG